MAWPDRGAASQVYPSTAPAPAALDIGADGQQQWLVQYSPHPTTPGLLLKQVLHAPQHAQVCKPHFQITWVLYCNLLCSMKQQLLCSLKWYITPDLQAGPTSLYCQPLLCMMSPAEHPPGCPAQCSHAIPHVHKLRCFATAA